MIRTCRRWRLKVCKRLLIVVAAFFLLLNLQALPPLTDGDYIEQLTWVRAGNLIHPEDVENPSGRNFVTVGMILVNLNKTEKLPIKVKSDVRRTLDGIFTNSVGTPLHLVVITEAEGALGVAQALAEILGEDLANRVIRPRSWHWRPKKGLPPLHISFVNLADVIACKPEFVRALEARKSNSDVGDKYISDLFYIGPIYHLAFTKLEKMIMLDSTDLGVVSDLKDLWSEFSELERSKDSLLAVGLDLAPHYFNQLNEYRRKWPSSKVGQPGRLQGLNTGVVLYHLARMRESALYNSYLHPEAVDHLMERYHLKMSVGDQDWFTALSFAQPRLFVQLPCTFNMQTSLQYWSSHKSMFWSYRHCEPGHLARIKIFHGNGCGPKPEDCGFGAVDINEYKDFIYIFNIIPACRFWQVVHCAFVCNWPAIVPDNDLTCAAEDF